jgi:hypothetical protein
MLSVMKSHNDGNSRNQAGSSDVGNACFSNKRDIERLRD